MTITFRITFALIFLLTVTTYANNNTDNFCSNPNISKKELDKAISGDWFDLHLSSKKKIHAEKDRILKIILLKNSNNFELALLNNRLAELSKYLKEENNAIKYYYKALILSKKTTSKRLFYFISINYAIHLKSNKLYEPAEKILNELLITFNETCEVSLRINASKVLKHLSSIANERGHWEENKLILNKLIKMESVRGNKKQLGTYINNLGYLYYKEFKNYSEAEHKFNQALELLQNARPTKNPLHDTLAIVNVQENIAHIHVIKKNYIVAERIYINVQNYRTKHKLKSIRAKLYLAELYLNHFSITKFSSLMEDLLKRYKNNINLINENEKVKFYQLLNNYAKKRIDFHLKNDAIDLSLALQKSFYENSLKSRVSSSSSYFNTIYNEALQKLNIETKLLENEKKNSELFKVILALLFIILILIISGFRIYSNRIKTKRDILLMKSQLADLELKKSKLELEANISTLENLKSDNIIKTQLLKSWLNELRFINNSKDISEVKKLIKSLTIDVKERLNRTKAFDHIIENINEINPLFQRKIISKYKNLSKREIQFCVLIKLNRSRNEIMTIMNVNLNAYKATQNRIRRKLELSSDITLRKFIGDF